MPPRPPPGSAPDSSRFGFAALSVVKAESLDIVDVCLLKSPNVIPPATFYITVTSSKHSV